MADTRAQAPGIDPDAAGATPSVARARRLDGGSTIGVGHYCSRMHRIYTTSVASVYPLYVAKVERKGRTQDEVDRVINWLTGFDDAELHRHLDAGTTFADFFAAARLNPDAALITGTVCGVRVQDVEDPLMRRIRYLDKLVDELARGRPMDKILRGDSTENATATPE